MGTEWINNMMNDRFKQPFSSAFLFAWFIYNWRVWILIFKYNIEQGGIEDFLSVVSEQMNLFSILILPFASALIYVYIINLLNVWAFEIKQDNKRDERAYKVLKENESKEFEKVEEVKSQRKQRQIVDPYDINLMDGKWTLEVKVNNSEHQSIATNCTIYKGQIKLGTVHGQKDNIEKKYYELKRIKYINYNIVDNRIDILFKTSAEDFMAKLQPYSSETAYSCNIYSDDEIYLLYTLLLTKINTNIIKEDVKVTSDQD